MKKHLIAILVVLCIASLVGVGIWFVVQRNKTPSLYQSCTSFVTDGNTKTLSQGMTKAQQLYAAKGSSADTRLTTLHNVILKLDLIQNDLNSYLILSNAKPSSTRKLVKSYKSLSSARSKLITNYAEYTTRMSGDTNISGSSVKDLYDDILGKTSSYIYKYHDCIKSINNYVFSKVYTPDTIKKEIYLLYLVSTENLLNSMSNYQFENSSLITITRFNNNIKLTNGVINLRETALGGEFSHHAIMFKNNFNKSNHSTLIKNFENYYSSTVNVTTETNVEKLTVHYLKLIMEV